MSYNIVDAYQVVGNPETSGMTSENRSRPVIIDFCFVGIDLATNVRSAGIEEYAVGSGHQPIYMEIEL